MEIFRLCEILLSQGHSTKEIQRKLRILKGIVKQLDGRTLGLIAYNDWNTHPEPCWCGKHPFHCKTCRISTDSALEKWMSIAHDFSSVDVVVQVEVSDIALYGFAVNGELIWHGVTYDCNQLPGAIIKTIEQLEKTIT